jgi:hypothetical protein
MWHAARRGARLAASNASTASAARALRGEAASRATGVASSWPAGASDASALARRLDWPSPSGFASAAHAAVAARGASGPRAPPLALRAARALLHASPASAGDERDKKYTGRPDGKDGKDHKTRKRDGEKGEKGERGSSALSASRYRDANVGSDAADDDRVLSELLAGAKAVAVREHLEALSSPDAADREPGTKPTTHLTRAAFDALLAEHGYADAASRADATRAFRDAGAVVVLGDLVYLDGAQVTRDILHALPAVPGAVYGLDPKTLAELESEMAAIQVDVDAAAARAARRSNAIVFGGLVLLCAQLATFVRLTYVELSWDVMEPISYFVGVFNAILLYVYFMVNQRDFSFDDWSKRMRAHFRRRNIERARVDAARYAALARRLGKKRGG